MSKILAAGLAVALLLAPLGASAQSRSRGRTATFLDMFPREHMTCGRRGWTFPGLIGGHVPLTACILKYRDNRGSSPFGPL